MSDEWGAWTRHDGKGCPCSGEYVQAKFCNGKMAEGLAINAYPGTPCENDGQWDWAFCAENDLARIIRYRIRRPKGLTILENLIAEIPEEVAG